MDPVNQKHLVSYVQSLTKMLIVILETLFASAWQSFDLCHIATTLTTLFYGGGWGITAEETTTVVSCAIFCSDHLTTSLISMRTKRCLRRSWITMEKLLDSLSPCLSCISEQLVLVASCCCRWNMSIWHLRRSYLQRLCSIIFLIFDTYNYFARSQILLINYNMI